MDFRSSIISSLKCIKRHHLPLSFLATVPPNKAILHHVNFAVVINLEPAASSDPALSIAGDVQSQKLTVRAIFYLQSLPAGDFPLLYDIVVHSLRDLTGYDRVMVYKFHNDEQDEVLAESKRPDLDPYISLHYPASPRLRGSSSSRTGLVGFRRESDPGRGPRSTSLLGWLHPPCPSWLPCPVHGQHGFHRFSGHGCHHQCQR
ncbi:hypothetical protein Fmac_011948 [Flemingia macrophylla]|uniref:Phytochrome chromophore attachment site domain-containing protein n=1 Tax=Flemingia macrophylla TaxID=520843 RepID=A0ABD1MPR4_9FABA